MTRHWLLALTIVAILCAASVVADDVDAVNQPETHHAARRQLPEDGPEFSVSGQDDAAIKQAQIYINEIRSMTPDEQASFGAKNTEFSKLITDYSRSLRAMYVRAQLLQMKLKLAKQQRVLASNESEKAVVQSSMDIIRKELHSNAMNALNNKMKLGKARMDNIVLHELAMVDELRRLLKSLQNTSI